MAVRINSGSGLYLSDSGNVGAPLTVCGWAKSADNGQYGAVYHHGTTSGSQHEAFVVNGSAVLFYTSFDSADFLTVNLDWFFWALTINTTSVDAYAALAGSNSLSSPSAQTTAPISGTERIGRTDGAGDPFNGLVANVKSWGAILTEAELLNEMRQYQPARFANLLRWTPLITHTELTDFSGLANPWTGNGTLTTDDGQPIPWKRGRGRIYVPDAGGGGGASAIAGSTTIDITASGALAAKGALAGSTTIDLAPAGAMQARGALAASADATISCTGTLTAKGALSSAAQIDVTASGALTGKGALAGETTITILADGALTGLGGGAMAGAAAISFDCSGSLTAKGSLAGSTAIDIAPAGTLQGRGSLAASAALTISCDGALTADGALTGSTTIDVAPAGVMTARGALAATATITFTLSAIADGTVPEPVNVWTSHRRPKEWEVERRSKEWEVHPA
jgi:hypothetical protein